MNWKVLPSRVTVPSCDNELDSASPLLQEYDTLRMVSELRDVRLVRLNIVQSPIANK